MFLDNLNQIYLSIISQISQLLLQPAHSVSMCDLCEL